MKKILAILLLLAGNCFGQFAAGGPGLDAQWQSAGKQAVGTSAASDSKVWFTLANGMLTEVFYPQVDTANVNALQFIVVDPRTKTARTERDDANHRVVSLKKDSLTFQQINTAKSGEWKITKTYITDPKRPVVLIQVEFETKTPGLELYIYFDPSINNSGMDDRGFARQRSLVAVEKNIAAALLASTKLEDLTAGYFGSSDPLTALRSFGKIPNADRSAGSGNVVLAAKVAKPASFTLALGFGENEKQAERAAAASLKLGFARLRAEYDGQWKKYALSLPEIDGIYRDQFVMAAMVLKAQEDKTYPGASVASLSTPWGGGINGNNVTSGYHLVWSRDLYHVATAHMALGDKAAALRSLDYLFKYQQREDGSFPQISWLDGRTVGDSIQLDEVSYPLILAYQLGRTDKKTYENHIKRSADYIAKTGPRTQQERWEEEAGYSPSTIAAEIAGLVCAAEIARINGDKDAAERWLAKADEWESNVEKLTATTTGKYGDGNYYLRLTANGDPDAGDKIELNNGAGTFDEREIVDAGFLELVRFGIKRADDPLIVRSLKVVDEKLRVQTPFGDGFYRYNNDGYGETFDGKRWNWDATWRGKGHLWVLLTGERGQYELAKCPESDAGPLDRTPSAKDRECLRPAEMRLKTMLGMTGEALMLPEQVWSRREIPTTPDLQFMPPLTFGKGTGSATPLAWSMSQFIRLAVNIKAGHNLETPDIVYRRYAGKSKAQN